MHGKHALLCLLEPDKLLAGSGQPGITLRNRGWEPTTAVLKTARKQLLSQFTPALPASALLSPPATRRPLLLLLLLTLQHALQQLHVARWRLHGQVEELDAAQVAHAHHVHALLAA